VTYTINLPAAAAPAFSPVAGTYTSVQTVTISDSTPATTIYYTTNGSTPTASSTQYTGPVQVSSSETINAIAVAVGYSLSNVGSATYTINLPAAAAPTFSPVAGTYTSVQTVTLADSTPGATIYFTVDGSTPTANSTVYHSALTVSSSATLKAIASASGYSLSAVATAGYTINLPPPSFTISGTPVSVAPGAITGNTSTISVTPTNGFTGAVSLSCAITPASSEPAVCLIPTSVTINGSGAQTVTLIVGTTAPTSALNRAKELLWPPVGGVAVAGILLVGFPARRRRWRSVLGMLVLLFSIAGGVLACGGVGSGGGGGGNSGTAPGAYVITVTGTSGSIMQTGTVSLTVQ